MAQPGKVPTKAPMVRHIDGRGLVYALDGAERPYNVYRFSGTQKLERPNHNPFKGL